MITKQLVFALTVSVLISAWSPRVCLADDEALPRPPNFVVIFTDDQGYNDLGCFGGRHVETPIIDQLASEGTKLTSFYVAAPLCTPSRAALMTGCYPRRVGMARGSKHAVLLASDPKGLHPKEVTVAEVLKQAGYATGIFGKWHLGDQPKFLPTRQGFGEFFGIPYSHDIHPYHPLQGSRYDFPPLPLLDDEKVIELDPNADFLTRRITERAVAFIEEHKQEPFFLYVPHPMPHRPLHVSPEFMESVPQRVKQKLALEGEKSVDYKTRDHLFSQAISEIDWSVGKIVETLKRNHLDEYTLLIFTSDNGPGGVPSASARPLRGRKGSSYEGGVRMPAFVRWPDHIPAGRTSDEILMSIDLLPTFAQLARTELPTDRVIDGKNVWPALAGKSKSPRKVVFYHRGNRLMAVRVGKWKLHVEGLEPQALFDLESDIGETQNVLAGHAALVQEMLRQINAFESDLAENSRAAGWVEDPVPLTKE